MLPAGTKSKHNALDHLSWCESAGGGGGGEREGKEGVKSKSTIFPGGGQKRLSPFRPTLQLFQKQYLEETSVRHDGAHVGFPEHVCYI